MKEMGALMLDLEGKALSGDDKARLTHPHTGGVILFSNNFEHRDQLIDLVQSIRRLRADILIAVDHEGGRIQRFRQGFTHIPAMSELGRLWENNSAHAICVATELGWLLAAELLACGIDLSFTPVLDIHFDRSDVIGDRAFSRDPVVVSQLAAALISGMRAAGMACVGKHFPGHGYVEADSHVTLPIDHRAWPDLEHNDLVPFKMLARHLDGIMPAHVAYPHLDERPAGFSAYWLKNILRESFGFDGLIFSDDLSMEGAAGYGTYPDRAQCALEAGCDMVLVCHHRDGADEVLHSGVLTHPVKMHRAARLRADWNFIPNWSQLISTRRWRNAQHTAQTLHQQT